MSKPGSGVEHAVHVSALWPDRGQTLAELFGLADWMKLAADRAP